ncbi:NAD(P)-dependent oxidoreductase [Chelatococcus sp. SYSU_G07232]|uniref:NAD(P)-dependent oxidoreductase n=1 Tax=Chelatococcus albus TaxID=3047466 RepID=A0ABT7AG79_9HYPH|nr:NAD(P)-dependent oxidoreductase [Chelatococcus sp. SYSU_G07232]MDJ1158375.1 NAD(P)-dependent oxidoreductase [Chelatococcus sp. SYSU_G07232]
MVATNERIGFIGLGLMGHGMAKNIVEKGFPLTVLAHRRRTAVDDLAARGAGEAVSAKALAEQSTIIFLCVTSSQEVEALVRGPDGLAVGARSGTIIVDCSTADPGSTLALAAELAPRGITFVDAPLSRTPKEAWEGTLDTMVGCDEVTFARLKPVLDTWAGRVVHIGRTGDGHKMKLLNNFISLGYAALYAEALALGRKVGITPQQFDSVLRGSRMDCGFYQTFMRYALEGDREAHRFTLRNAHKDTRYVAAMADAAGLANPLGNAVKNSFALAVAAGRGDDYVPMLADIVADLNGIAPASVAS